MDSEQTDLELISFDLCPYVQRAVIALNEKGVPHLRTNIDLANKPDWFMQISPFGKVPILRHGKNVIFESAAILEYLDEITEPRLHPEDPLKKALNRAWIQFAGELTNASYNHATAKSQAEMEAAEKILRDYLGRLENILAEGPFFNGKQFSLVDIAFAPFMLRIHLLSSPALERDLLSQYPKVSAWSDLLLARDSVQQSIPDNYGLRAARRYANNHSWLAEKYLEKYVQGT